MKKPGDYFPPRNDVDFDWVLQGTCKLTNMAEGVMCGFSALVIFCLLQPLTSGLRYGSPASTLHFPKPSDEDIWGKGVQVVTAENWLSKSEHLRFARSLQPTPNPDTENITSVVSCHLVPGLFRACHVMETPCSKKCVYLVCVV